MVYEDHLSTYGPIQERHEAARMYNAHQESCAAAAKDFFI